MDTWRGQFPITSFVLMTLSDRIRDPAHGSLSQDEQVLYDACAFWAAVASRSLREYFGHDPAARLLAAQQAFAVVGAAHVDRALRVAFLDLVREPEGRMAPLLARVLEDSLRATDDDVDRLISAYAADRLQAQPAKQ
jgi:hypothetical protein